MTARPLIAGAVVVLLALALRLALLHSARFGGDEALFFGIASDIVDGKSFPLLGTQITDGQGRLPGPAFLYVIAIQLLIARAPEAQYAFVEILGAFTVGVFWHALRRPFGERAALFAGVLMALSPWSALYADRTWNPNVLPLVVMLALLAAIRLRTDPASPWLAAFLPLCAVMPQFHMSAPVAWAGLVVIAWPVARSWTAGRAWRDRRSRRHLAVGVALSALLYVPLAVHEAKTGFGNTAAIIAETVGNKERFPTSFLWVPVYALRFLTLDVTYHELSGYWGGPDEVACLKAAVFGSRPRPFHPLRLLAMTSSLALALAALAVLVRSARARIGDTRVYAWAFAAALVTNVAFIGLSGKQVFGHYVTNMFPFAFVAYAALGAALFERGRDPPTRLARLSVLALAAIFCVGGVEATLAISARVDGRIGLRVHRETLEKIDADAKREHLENDPVRLDFGYFSSLYDWSAFASRAMNLKIRFDKRSKTRAYRLVEKDHPLADGAFTEGPIDVGYALLYRL